MKKLILTLILFLSLNSSIHAEWKDDWALAVQMCQEGNYEEAEKKFTKCILDFESSSNITRPHIYVDRARLYLLQNRYEEALKDLDIAINNPNLTKKELTRALVSRICAKSNLGISDGIVDDLTAFHESQAAPQEMEFTKKHIIIRNVPECECFKDIMSNFAVRAGYCKSVSDIKMLNSGTWIIERTDTCDCGCGKSFKGLSLSSSNEPGSCVEWCDYCAIAGSAWCAKIFKRYDCQVGCLSAVELIKRHICYPCCRSRNFYETCVKPFEDILAHMGNRCDPYWD